MEKHIAIGPSIWRRHGVGPRLGIVAALHGDELAGAAVVDELVSPTHRLWRYAGHDPDVTFAIGNPSARGHGGRAAPDGRDLNRHFADVGGTLERVDELKAALEGVERLVDLHQTACHSPALAVCPADPEHLSLAADVGVPIVVSGVEQVYGDGMLSYWVDRQGGVGLTIETGKKGTVKALETSWQIVERLVLNLPSHVRRMRHYELVEAVVAPADDVKFTRILANTSPVHDGEILGYADGWPITAPADGALFLPRPGANEGEPCALFGIDRGWVSAPG